MDLKEAIKIAEEGYELRMYGLVPYNLSPIQQGIQFGHAVVEAFNWWEDGNAALLNNWSMNWKTFIILNGGTTNDNVDFKGTLNQHFETLLANGINFSYFREPDLGDQLTAITFIVDERVFNTKKYPDYVEFPQLENINYNELLMLPTLLEPQSYDDWVENIGGEKNVFLRKFLSQFKLA